MKVQWFAGLGQEGKRETYGGYLLVWDILNTSDVTNTDVQSAKSPPEGSI